MIELAAEHDDLIPLIWQMSEPTSPGAVQRFDFFAGEEIPLGMFNGELSYIGEEAAAAQYSDFYDQLSGVQTPWLLDLRFGFDDAGNYKLNADIELEENIEPDSIRILFALTRHDQSNYSSLVIKSSVDQSVTITQAGETISLEEIFEPDEYYEFTSLRAVAVLQNMTTRQTLQSIHTPITQLIPDLQTSLDSGPASLGVHFQSTSFPVEGISSWQWDFQNDGVIDSWEENPYFVFDEPGVYDVKLMITDGVSRNEKLFPELITVNDTDQVEGTVTGVWRSQFNPYIIVDDVSIPYYGELVIEPGTEILVDYNKRLNVYGRLQIAGNAGEPVILTSNDTWKGIKLLNSTEDNIIEYAHISNTSLSALNASYSSLQIHNSLFYNNLSGSLGAAVNLLGCTDALLTGNRIYNNSSSLTGGVAMRSSNPLMINNIIANNDGSMAGALVIREDSEPIFINNVIANNSAPVAAIFVDESTPEFVNNIFIDEADVFLGDLNAMRIDYTISSQELPGETNITVDPLFIDPTPASGSEYDALAADWHLQLDSPAIDSGNPSNDYNDPEDPQNPGYALYPALGLLRNDIGAYGGPGIIPELVPNSEDNIIPASQVSLLVYPNPYQPDNNRAQINFLIESAAGGDISIYNAKGQKVTTLQLAADQNTIAWSPNKNLASGIYLIRWQQNFRNTTSKLMFIK